MSIYSDANATVANQMRTNTASYYNPLTIIPPYNQERLLSDRQVNDSTTFANYNHTFSILTKRQTPKYFGDDKIQQTTKVYLDSYTNVFFSAFGKFFDVLLCPDLKDVSVDFSELNPALSVFYHGHLKGIKDDSYISVTFQDGQLVSLF